MRLHFATIFGVPFLAFSGCRAGPIDDDDHAQDDTPKDIPEGVIGDRWHCGELGLKCVGPLGIGECIDEQCTPHLGPDCRSAKTAPTCDDYCQTYGLSCAHQGCEGATVWGWIGNPEWADAMCLDGDKSSATPLTVACDDPLEGLLDTFNCCCE